MMRALLVSILAAVAAGSVTALVLQGWRFFRARRQARRMARSRESLTREMRAEWERTASVLTARQARQAVRDLLARYDGAAPIDGFDERGILLPPPVRASYDPVTKRIHAQIPIDGETLGRLADRSYADGMTHAQVTAYLASTVPGFRAYLLEAVCLDNSLRWVWLGPELRRKRPA